MVTSATIQKKTRNYSQHIVAFKIIRVLDQAQGDPDSNPYSAIKILGDFKPVTLSVLRHSSVMDKTLG